MQGVLRERRGRGVAVRKQGFIVVRSGDKVAISGCDPDVDGLISEYRRYFIFEARFRSFFLSILLFFFTFFCCKVPHFF